MDIIDRYNLLLINRYYWLVSLTFPSGRVTPEGFGGLLTRLRSLTLLPAALFGSAFPLYLFLFSFLSVPLSISLCIFACCVVSRRLSLRPAAQLFFPFISCRRRWLLFLTPGFLSALCIFAGYLYMARPCLLLCIPLAVGQPSVGHPVTGVFIRLSGPPCMGPFSLCSCHGAGASLLPLLYVFSLRLFFHPGGGLSRPISGPLECAFRGGNCLFGLVVCLHNFPRCNRLGK